MCFRLNDFSFFQKILLSFSSHDCWHELFVGNWGWGSLWLVLVFWFVRESHCCLLDIIKNNNSIAYVILRPTEFYDILFGLNDFCYSLFSFLVLLEIPRTFNHFWTPKKLNIFLICFLNYRSLWDSKENIFLVLPWSLQI